MNLVKDNGLPYLSHMPDVLKEFIEIKAIGTAIDIEMEKFYEIANQSIENRFTESMNLSAVQRWEKILQISSPIDDTLSSRRHAIKAKLLSQPPINISTLKRIVEAFLGVEVDIEVHKEPYVVHCTYRGITDLPDTTPLFKKIYEMIPAHMEVLLSYAYQTWQSIHARTWNDVKSSSWYEVLMAL